MALYQFEACTKNAPPDNSSREEFTLYVNNLPEELDEVGLTEIFNHYGEIIGRFYRKNANWAYITYASYNEAESAIKDLHDKSPLCLTVSFAKAKAKACNRMQFAKASVDESINRQYGNHIEKDIKASELPHIEIRGRGRPMDILKTVKQNPGLSEYNYTLNDDLLYPYPPDPYTYNPYKNSDPQSSAAALWTRGQLNITQDGKRHVSLGRGYTLYEIPDPDPELQNRISKVYERRTSDLYEYGKDVLQNTIGKCLKCLRLTKFTCERCHGFYCSTVCQREDWPRHKIECDPIPGLVTSVKSLSTLQLNNEDHTLSRVPQSTQVPLRRPKKLMDTMSSSQQNAEIISEDQNSLNASPLPSNNSENNDHTLHFRSKIANQHNSCEKTKESTCDQNNTQSNQTVPNSTLDFNSKHNIQLQQTREQNNSASFNKTLERNLQSKHIENSNNIVRNEKSENRENNIDKQQNCIANNVAKIEEDIAFFKDGFLSKTKFLDVIVIEKEGREIWIQKLENDDKLREMMNNLQSDAEKAQKVSPAIGDMCAVQYETIWHRAVVTCLNPLKVHYIDYGNTEPVQLNDFREIIKYKKIPRFGAKIRLSEKVNEKYKNLKYEDVISVKMISVDSDDVINVQVEGEEEIPIIDVPQANSTPKPKVKTNLEVDNKISKPPKTLVNDKAENSLNKVKNIINTVSTGEEGILEIHAELSNNTYSITLLPNNAMTAFEEILQELPATCEQIAPNSNHRSHIGELICGQRLDDDWLRGYVLSLESPLKMAIIDEARVMIIKKTVPCPEKFLQISAFGATCEVIGAKNKFNAAEHYQFKVLSCKTNTDQTEIEIEISNDEDKLKAIVKPWIPVPEQKGIRYAELTSGSEVCLTAFDSHYALFVRSLQAAESERYTRIMQSVAKCAQTAPSLTETPVVGQMVIAPYLDDNYYRAIVTKVKDEKVAISYVDFGNKEVTTTQKLKVLSDDLKQLQACATKVVLKDVPQDVPMTTEISEYLSVIVGTEAPAICTFDGTLLKDGVLLKLYNGDIINDKIRELLVPTWNKPEEDKTCYMINDLSVANLGKVGDVLDVVVLYALQDGYKYAMCPFDQDLMTHVYNIMPKLITEYCEKSSFYIPRENELCLALYENEWYRAYCDCRNETATTSSVLFVDFGNFESVNHKDIRLMPKDFMTPNALASFCTIVNLAPTDSKGRFTPEIEKRISELIILNNCIKIKIVDANEENGVYNVELPLVRETLIKEGLISP